jgi:hypothetical protein
LSSSLCKNECEQDRIVCEAMLDQFNAESVQTLISRT